MRNGDNEADVCKEFRAVLYSSGSQCRESLSLQKARASDYAAGRPSDGRCEAARIRRNHYLTAFGGEELTYMVGILILVGGFYETTH